MFKARLVEILIIVVLLIIVAGLITASGCSTMRGLASDIGDGARAEPGGLAESIAQY